MPSWAHAWTEGLSSAATGSRSIQGMIFCATSEDRATSIETVGHASITTMGATALRVSNPRATPARAVKTSPPNTAVMRLTSRSGDSVTPVRAGVSRYAPPATISAQQAVASANPAATTVFAASTRPRRGSRVNVMAASRRVNSPLMSRTEAAMTIHDPGMQAMVAMRPKVMSAAGKNARPKPKTTISTAPRGNTTLPETVLATLRASTATVRGSARGDGVQVATECSGERVSVMVMPFGRVLGRGFGEGRQAARSVPEVRAKYCSSRSALSPVVWSASRRPPPIITTRWARRETSWSW